MDDFRSPGQQILSGVLTAIWLIALPFMLAWRLLRWFVVGVVQEAGNKILKIVGAVVALAIIGWVVQIFLH